LFKQIRSGLFSVIIPTIGDLESLNTSVGSVLKQIYKQYEILVICDSPEKKDKIKIWIESLNQNTIVFLENKQQKGGNGARNTGILNAKGEIICFLDDDDEWHPERLKEAFKTLNMTSDFIGGCYTGFEYWNGRFIEKHKLLIEDAIEKEILVNQYNFGNSSNLIFKKAAIEKIGLWDEKLKRHQDYEYLLRFLKQFKLIPINRVLLRINGHSTRPQAMTMVNAKIRFIFKIRRSINSLTEKQYKQFFFRQYNELANMLAGEGKARLACYFNQKANRLHLRNDLKKQGKFYIKLLFAPLLRLRWFLFNRFGMMLFFKKKYRNRQGS
jgi:glycosyltransferase involved in cell wall biosynthesis